MNKEELRKTIIKELRYILPTELGEKTIDYFANNIMVNIPDDFEIIAITRANYLRLEQIELIGLIVDKYEDKNIEIGIRIKRNNE